MHSILGHHRNWRIFLVCCLGVRVHCSAWNVMVTWKMDLSLCTRYTVHYIYGIYVREARHIWRVCLGIGSVNNKYRKDTKKYEIYFPLEANRKKKKRKLFATREHLRIQVLLFCTSIKWPFKKKFYISSSVYWNYRLNVAERLLYSLVLVQ